MEPKLPWPSIKRVAQGEVLRHADQGVIDGRIAVGMVLAHDVAGDLGAFAGGPVEVQPQLVHAVQDAAMHRLQTVADIGERAAHDHAHGVIEVAAPHLVFDVDRDVVLVPAVSA